MDIMDEKMVVGDRWVDPNSESNDTYVIKDIDRDMEMVRIKWDESGILERFGYKMFKGDRKIEVESEEPVKVEPVNEHIVEVLGRQKNEVQQLKISIADIEKSIAENQVHLAELKDALIVSRRMLDAGERKVKRLKV